MKILSPSAMRVRLWCIFFVLLATNGALSAELKLGTVIRLCRGSKKPWISACHLGKQLSHFTCLTWSVWFSWRMTWLSLCSFHKWALKVTFKESKSTCPYLPVYIACIFFKPCPGRWSDQGSNLRPPNKQTTTFPTEPNGWQLVVMEAACRADFRDQFKFLGNCPPTPPLSKH